MTDSHFVDIEWDNDKNSLNKNKHRITFEEAATIFNDPLELTISDPGHSLAENRFISVGQSSANKLIVVSFTERGGLVRLISARRPTKAERTTYEEP